MIFPWFFKKTNLVIVMLMKQKSIALFFEICFNSSVVFFTAPGTLLFKHTYKGIII